MDAPAKRDLHSVMHFQQEYGHSFVEIRSRMSEMYRKHIVIEGCVLEWCTLIGIHCDGELIVKDK